MKKVFNDSIVTAIDIGTTKICVLVARKVGEEIEILGIGKAPSHGLKKGIVTDIAKTVESIKAAVKEAELVTDIEITSAIVGISGSHIKAFNSHGAVPIKKNNKVTKADILAVIQAAKAIAIPEGQQTLHVLPQYFSIDGQEKIQDPLGMHGVRLEAQVHIITGSIASAQNIIESCQQAGVHVTDIVLEQLASAHAVLSHDERELGVCIIDIGGGTSDVAVFHQGSMRHTMVLPIAGNHFTHDVAVGLQTTIQDAERVKKEFGCADTSLIESPLQFQVQAAHGTHQQQVDQLYLANIIEMRAIELLSLIKKEIDMYTLTPMMPTGVVLTGGGSLLKGMTNVAHATFHTPVRIGHPRTYPGMPESLNNPMYATGYGLLMYALKDQPSVITQDNAPMVFKVFDRMKSWISDFF